MEIAAFEGRKL